MEDINADGKTVEARQFERLIGDRLTRATTRHNCTSDEQDVAFALLMEEAKNDAGAVTDEQIDHAISGAKDYVLKRAERLNALHRFDDALHEKGLKEIAEKLGMTFRAAQAVTQKLFDETNGNAEAVTTQQIENAFKTIG